MLEAKILLFFLLGILSDAITFDSREEGFGALINHHTPSWNFINGKNGLESSFQQFYPLFDDNYDHKSFHWPLTHFKPLFPPVKLSPPVRPPPPVQPAPPIQPTPTSSQSQSSTREWPSWIPPIRLIKLPLDEPPAAIQNQNSLALYYDLDDF